MTREPLGDVEITSTDEFEDALTAIVEAAVENGVNVRGAWEFRTGGSTHDWEVQVVELQRGSDD